MTFFKMSLYNITFSYIIYKNTFSDAFKMQQITCPTATLLAHYFLILKMLLYKLAQTNKCPN